PAWMRRRLFRMRERMSRGGVTSSMLSETDPPGLKESSSSWQSRRDTIRALKQSTSTSPSGSRHLARKWPGKPTPRARRPRRPAAGSRSGYSTFAISRAPSRTSGSLMTSTIVGRRRRPGKGAGGGSSGDVQDGLVALGLADDALDADRGFAEEMLGVLQPLL